MVVTNVAFTLRTHVRGRQAARGFTLIDVLIVVAIIALLVSVLLPAAGTIRASARATHCLANVRSILLAFQSFRGEHRGQWTGFPYPPRTWVSDLQKHIGHQDAYFCPEASDPSSGWAGGLPFGTSHMRWGPGTDTPSAQDIGKDSSSYGINTWLYTRSVVNAAQYDANPSSFIDPANASNPSNTPFIADAVWVGGMPEYTDTPPAALENPLDGNIWVAEMRRFCVGRHLRRVSVGFLDGGAKGVPVAELWQLNWHNGWRPQNVFVP
jgi:prepilin-type N-terminal cleavage/methylation domain-containing protein